MLNRRDRIIAEAQERLLGPDGKLHPAEYTVTELALVETTDDDPTKVHTPAELRVAGVPACMFGRYPGGWLLRPVYRSVVALLALIVSMTHAATAAFHCSDDVMDDRSTADSPWSWPLLIPAVADAVDVPAGIA